MDYTVHGILQARIQEWVAVPFSRGSSQPGIEHKSPALQANSLPAEPQEKPMSRYKVLICLLGAVILAAEGQGLLFSLSVPSSWYSDPYERYFLPVC